MIKKKPVLIVVLVLIVLALTIAGVKYGLSTSPTESYTTRPSDFPEILIALEQGRVSDYGLTKERDSTAIYAYSITCFVHDPYPSEQTYQFTSARLRSHGWHRLNYQLLNPLSEAFEHDKIPATFDPEIAKPFLSKEQQREGVGSVHWIMEDWIKGDFHISLILSYGCDTKRGIIFLDEVCVEPILTVAQRENSQWIARYRKLHPDEFSQ